MYWKFKMRLSRRWRHKGKYVNVSDVESWEKQATKIDTKKLQKQVKKTVRREQRRKGESRLHCLQSCQGTDWCKSVKLCHAKLTLPSHVAKHILNFSFPSLCYIDSHWEASLCKEILAHCLPVQLPSSGRRFSAQKVTVQERKQHKR